MAQFLALTFSLGLIAALWLLRGKFSALALVGYPGVLLLSFLGSVTMLLPVPGLLSICGVSIVLNPMVVGLLGGVGETAGELSGYAVGYGSQGVIARRRFYATVATWMQRRGTLVLFLASAIPNPLFDVVGLAAGATRFPLVRFLAIVWVGKSVKSLMVAYTCFYGIQFLPWTV